MISMYVGLPGSGKSYSLMRYVVGPAMREGRRVVTNLPVLEDELTEYSGGRGKLEIVEVKDLNDEESFAKLDLRGAVVVLDEVWRLWPAGMQAAKMPEYHRQLLAEHRHMVDVEGRSTEIVLCTQDAGQCASYIRQLVDTTYKTVSMARFGKRNGYRVDVYEGCRPSKQLTRKMRQREMYGTYDPAVFALYRSHTHSAAGLAGNERETDSRRSVLSSAGVRVVLPLAALVCVGSLVYLWTWFHGGEAEAEPAEPAPSERTASERPARPSPVAADGPRGLIPTGITRAPAARIAGVVHDARMHGYAAIVSDGRTYQVDLGQCWQEYVGEWSCAWRGQTVRY